MKKILSFLIVIISLFMFISVRAIDDEDPVDQEVNPITEPDTPTDPPTDTPVDNPTDNPIDTPADNPTNDPVDTLTDNPIDTPVDTQPQTQQQPVEQPKIVVQPKKEEKKEEVTITEVEEEKTGLLIRIDSKIVKIVLKEDVYEYNVSIDSDIEKLDLEPIKKDDDTTIEISTQVIKELEDNKITIKVKKGDIEETYIIHVRVRPEIKEEVKIENTNYKEKYLAFILFFGIIIIACVFLMKKEK